jgi:enoyl-CoA hydratase/carnithine racemase
VPDVHLECANAIGTVTIDRPPVNALASATYAELIERFREVGGRTDVAVVVLRATGDRCFSAGADVGELRTMADAGDPAADERRQTLAFDLFDTVLRTPQPVIAALNGPALGAGAVLAACSDIRYASERATIGLPEINVGRCGGGRHLMRLFPQGKLREMYFTGEPVDAVEAHRLGAFDRVFPHGEELKGALGLARVIAGKSPLALRLAKEALNGAESLPIADGYALEQTYTLRLGRSEDAKEAARAFVEKRQPVWTGR